MDTPETLAADMLKAVATAQVGSRAVVGMSAKAIKDEAKKNVRKSAPAHNAGAAEAITYNSGFKGSQVIEAEIGYDKDRPGGALGNLLEYGSRKNPPHRDLGRALDAEAPNFEVALAKAAGEFLR